MSTATPGTLRLIRRTPQVAVGVSATAIAALLLADRTLPVGLSLAAVVGCFGAWLVVYEHEQRGYRVDLRILAVAIGAVLAIAVVLAPTGSHDVWSYTMYGRMVARYGVSPYSHVPANFRHDPFLHLVSPGWRHTPSVYGPAFVVFTTIGSAFAGGSMLIARLFHQVGAALAVAVALSLIWRRTRSAAAVMLLGLNPLVVLDVVNGGHNDALVGLGILGAVLLTEKRRLIIAGLVLGLVALIKITALLALPALVAWALVRFGRRAAEQLTGVAVASVALGYALAGPSAVAATNANHRLMSRISLWQSARSLVRQNGSAFLGLTRHEWLTGFSVAAVVVVCGLAVAVAWRHRSDADLGGVVALALAAYLVAGLYVLPWYGMWMLPAACLVRRRSVLMFSAGLGAFFTAVYLVKSHALPGTVGVGWWWIGAYIGPLAALVAYLVLALVPERHRVRSRNRRADVVPVLLSHEAART